MSQRHCHLLVAALLVLAGPSIVQATPIVSVSAEGLASATAAESAFLSGLDVSVTESFEGFTPVFKATTLSTSVGSFQQIVKGNDISNCITPPVSGCTGLVVLNASESPFAGRFATDGAHWLDSNDSKTMTFEGATPWTSIGFYLTDPNDAGATINLKGFDGSGTEVLSTILFPSSLPNGNVYYVSIFAEEGLKSLTFYSDAGGGNDGFGLDNFTVGNVASTVPEPGSMLLLGAGLLGLAAFRRRSL